MTTAIQRRARVAGDAAAASRVGRFGRTAAAIALASMLAPFQVRSADTRLELPPIIVNAPEESEQLEPTPTPKPLEERVRDALQPKPVGITETRGDATRDSVVRVRSSVMTYCLKHNLLARRDNIGDNVTVPTNCPN